MSNPNVSTPAPVLATPANSDNVNRFEATNTAFLKSQFPGLRIEVAVVPKPLRKGDAVPKDADKPSARIKPSDNGDGYNGTASGRTVNGMLAAPALAAAYIHQRVMQGAERGAIPQDVLARYTDAWTLFTTNESQDADGKTVRTLKPGLREAAERLLLSVPAEQPPTKQTVTTRYNGTECIHSIPNGKADDTGAAARQREILYAHLRDGVKVYTREKDAKDKSGKKTKDVYAGTVFGGVLKTDAPEIQQVAAA